jgi:hypothetical protein
MKKPLMIFQSIRSTAIHYWNGTSVICIEPNESSHKVGEHMTTLEDKYCMLQLKQAYDSVRDIVFLGYSNAEYRILATN